MSSELRIKVRDFRASSTNYVRSRCAARPDVRVTVAGMRAVFGYIEQVLSPLLPPPED